MPASSLSSSKPIASYSLAFFLLAVLSLAASASPPVELRPCPHPAPFDLDGDGVVEVVCPPLVYKPPGAAVARLEGVNATLLYDVDGDGLLDLVAWGASGVTVYTAGGGRLLLSGEGVECSVSRGFLECGGRAWWRGGFLPPGRIPAPPFGGPVGYGGGWIEAGGVNVSTPCAPFTAWSDGVHYVVVASCPGSGAVFYVDARTGRVYSVGLPGEPRAASILDEGVLVDVGGEVLLVSWGGIRLVAAPGRLYPGHPPVVYADGVLRVYGLRVSVEPPCEPSSAVYNEGVVVAVCGDTAYVYGLCRATPVVHAPLYATALNPFTVTCEYCTEILVNGTGFPAPRAVILPRRPGTLLVQAVLVDGWCRDVATARVRVSAAKPRLVVTPLEPLVAGGAARLYVTVVYKGVNVTAACNVTAGGVTLEVTAPAVVEVPVGYVDRVDLEVSCKPLNASFAPVSTRLDLPVRPGVPHVNVTHPAPGVVGFVAEPGTAEVLARCVGNGSVEARGVGAAYVTLPAPGEWRCLVAVRGPGLETTVHEYRVEYRVVAGGAAPREALVVDRVVTKVEYVTRTFYLTVRGPEEKRGGIPWAYVAAGVAAGAAIGFLGGRRRAANIVRLGG